MCVWWQTSHQSHQTHTTPIAHRTGKGCKRHDEALQADDRNTPPTTPPGPAQVDSKVRRVISCDLLSTGFTPSISSPHSEARSRVCEKYPGRIHERPWARTTHRRPQARMHVCHAVDRARMRRPLRTSIMNAMARHRRSPVCMHAGRGPSGPEGTPSTKATSTAELSSHRGNQRKQLHAPGHREDEWCDIYWGKVR